MGNFYSQLIHWENIVDKTGKIDKGQILKGPEGQVKKLRSYLEGSVFPEAYAGQCLISAEKSAGW